MDWLKFLDILFGRDRRKRKITKGTVVLGSGQHELEIKLDGTPVRVYFSLRLPCEDCIPVCGAPAGNRVTVTITHQGFKVNADIETNCATLNWACEF